MMTSRRRAAALALVLVIAAACTGTTPSSSAPSLAPTATPVASSPSASPAATSEPSPSEAACREVTHALGSSCIPADPQRVVTLGCQTSLEYAIALELPLVGYDVAPWEPAVPPYLDQSKLSGATSVGSCFEPDLEQVKALEPDLIIYTFDAGNYPQVSAIAPAVVLQVGYVSYRDDFLAAAGLFDRTDTADQVLADLDARIADLRAELAPRVEGKTVSALRTRTDGEAEIYGKESLVGGILDELGMQRPADQQGEGGRVSLEQIGMMDGDIGLVVFGFTDPSAADAVEATKKQYVENPLWATLAFVQNDELHEMDPAVWGLHGIYWVGGMLDDIEAKLLP